MEMNTFRKKLVTDRYFIPQLNKVQQWSPCQQYMTEKPMVATIIKACCHCCHGNAIPDETDINAYNLVMSRYNSSIFFAVKWSYVNSYSVMATRIKQ